jgi:hypothetical protein
MSKWGPMPTKADKLDYIASQAKELVEISDDLGRRTLSYLLRMTIMEAQDGVHDNSRQLIASLVKELAAMSEELGRPTLSYLLRMAELEAEDAVADGPRPGGYG